MMENKTGHQIEPAIQNWPLTNIAVSILGILAPAAIFAIISNYPSEIRDYFFSSRPPDPVHRDLNPPWYYLHHWLSQWLAIRKNTQNKIKPLNSRDVWIDGSLLCTFVNIAVPGACKDPREHRLKTPKHGQQLVHEYMNILPIFTSKELTQKFLSFPQQQKFDRYLEKIHGIVIQQIDRFNNMKFSTDYVARGMGLVVAQQNRKSSFYIYPIPKKQQYICDIEIEINGPCGNKGRIVVPSIMHRDQKCQPATDYQRALYMSSKLNSISPTILGSSFLRRLSLPGYEGHNNELDIKVKVTSTRAKVSYHPQQVGVYEINLMTQGCHIVGSPYTIPVEPSSINSNDSDTDSDDERSERYVRKKKKIITRIVDFIDKKMLLQDDGTLVKIEENIVPEVINSNQKDNEDEVIPTTKSYQISLLTPDLLEVNTTESIPVFNQINHTLSPKVVASNLEPPKENIVVNLVKVFDSPLHNSLVLNDPDLVKCHIKKTDKSSGVTKNNLQDKLMKNGAISSKYDVSQCKLKTDLTIGLQERFKAQKSKIVKEVNENVIIEEYTPGLVGRQKRFWQERNNNSASPLIKPKINALPSPEKVKLLLDVYTLKTPVKICNKENSELEQPSKGIVENTRRLFEDPSIKDSNIDDLPNKKYLSLSLNNVEDLNQEIILQQKENMKIPSLEERKNKFLEACHSVDNVIDKESPIYCQTGYEINKTCLVEKEDYIFQNCSNNVIEVKPILRESEELEKNVNIFEYSNNFKNSNKCSLRRKSRFQRAKLFFQNLESCRSEPDFMNISDSNSDEDIFKNNVSISSNSASDVTEFESEKENSQNQNNIFKISDRFLVDDLFKDILDDRRFIGVPNKIAMAASLASLNSSYEEERRENLLENYDQNNLQYFEKTAPENDDNYLSINEEHIPGFHKEYPHPPTTIRWKPRSSIRGINLDENIDELIPGDVLLKKKDERV